MKIIPNANARSDFWCLTTYFNPAHYKSRLVNHTTYVENLKNVNLCVLECVFGDDDFELPESPNTIRTRSNSVLWPKERMLNHALSLLPPECKYIAWLDGDILFENDNWQELAVAKFEQGNDIIQLFDEVKYLPPNCKTIQDNILYSEKGLVWQSKTFPDFKEQRKKNKLLYATTGFAWAGRRSTFENGFYDKHVLGANDNIIIDCCLNTFDLHHYFRAGQGSLILNDMMEWAKQFGNPKADYLPIKIYHLFHGAKKNRGYLSREDIIKKYNYDPKTDIVLKDNVYEWATDKPGLHQEVKNYFSSRKEDSDEL